MPQIPIRRIPIKAVKDLIAVTEQDTHIAVEGLLSEYAGKNEITRTFGIRSHESTIVRQPRTKNKATVL